MTDRTDGVVNSGSSPRVGRDVAIYGLSSLLTQSAVLVATPVLARSLGPAQYGIVEVLVVVVAFASLIAIAGVDTAALRLYYERKEPAERQLVFSTGLIWTMVSSGLLGAAAFGLAGPGSDLLFGDAGDTDAVRLAALSVPLVALMLFTREALRAEMLPWRYLVSAVLASILQVGVACSLVVFTDAGPSGVMAGWLIAAVAALAFNFVATTGLFAIRLGRQVLRSLLTFGVPLLLTGMAGWSAMFVDRLVLTGFVTLRELGAYALANKVALVLTLAIYSFNRAWTPHALALGQDDLPASVRQRADTLLGYLAVVAWIAVSGSALAPLLIPIVGGRGYEDAVDVVPVLAFAFLLFAFIPILQIGMMLVKRTALLAWPAVLAAAVNLLLCVALAPSLGIMGAAVATVVGFGLQTAIYAYLDHTIEPVPYPWRGVARLMLMTVGFLAAAYLPDDDVLGVLAHVALVVVFPLVLLALGIVRRAEVAELLDRVRKTTRHGGREVP